MTDLYKDPDGRINPDSIGEEEPAESVRTANQSTTGWKEVDIVEKGADPTGNDLINPIINEHIDDGVKFVFPDGQYLSNAIEFDATDTTKVAFEARGDVSVSMPAGPSEAWILPDTSNAPDVLEVHDFEFTSGDEHRSIVAAANDLVRITDVTTRGRIEKNHSGALRVQLNDPDGVAYVENFRAPDGSGSGYDPRPIGVLVGSANVGRVYLKDCHIEGFESHGLYSSSTSGTTHVIGGLWKNNGKANIRFQADNSTVRDAKLVQDTNGHDGRGIRFRQGDGHVAENCELIHSDSNDTSTVVEWYQWAGSATIRDCNIKLDGHGGLIFDAQSFDSSNGDSYGSFAAHISDCTLSGTASYSSGSASSFARQATIKGNEIDVSSPSDQLVSIGSDTTVQNNIVTADTTLFRAFSGVSNVSFVGNRLTNTSGSAELVLQGSNYSIVANICDNGFTAGYTQAGNIVLN